MLRRWCPTAVIFLYGFSGLLRLTVTCGDRSRNNRSCWKDIKSVWTSAPPWAKNCSLKRLDSPARYSCNVCIECFFTRDHYFTLEYKLVCRIWKSLPEMLLDPDVLRSIRALRRSSRVGRRACRIACVSDTSLRYDTERPTRSSGPTDTLSRTWSSKKHARGI